MNGGGWIVGLIVAALLLFIWLKRRGVLPIGARFLRSGDAKIVVEPGQILEYTGLPSAKRQTLLDFLSPLVEPGGRMTIVLYQQDRRWTRIKLTPAYPQEVEQQIRNFLLAEL